MLLRRITEHVKAQNWTAVALDFVIVVVGVFMGIQLGNWNEARVNHETETTYLELLQRDLRTTVDEVENQIAFEQFQVQLANNALPIIEQSPSELRRRKLGITLNRLSGRRTLKIDSPTFLDLQSSGRLGLVSDPELRSSILSYFFAAQRWEAVIEKNNAHFVDDGYSGFMDNYSIGYWLWDDEVMGSAPPGIVSAILAQQKSSIDPRLTQAGGAMLMAPRDDAFWDEVKVRLGKRAGIASANQSVASALRDETAALEEKITAYLEGRL
ncbi:MAG: hypothetical protein HKN14_08490 [Marinicaulis sp.]|nr:hypothetical protein [Marinicaulis sp.]NNL87576.1 hypothetical protein [Marinicaulis sp.]